MKHTRKGYLVKRGRVYYAVWYVEGKKFSQTTSERSKDKALVELRRLMAPFVTGNDVRVLETVKARIEGARADLAAYDDQKNPPLTLDKAWFVYEQHPGRPDSGANTMRQYAAELERFRRWIEREHPGSDKERPGRIPLREIPAAWAQEYARDLGTARLAPSTFNQHVKFLSLLWRVLAKEIKGEGVNPWAAIARKRLNPIANRKRALTAQQFDNLLVAAESDPDARDLILVLAWTGLRLVDAVKMTWGAIDFSRRVITVTPQKTLRRTGKTVSIPMFPAVKEVLDRRQDGKTVNPSRMVFPELVTEYVKDGGSTLAKRMGMLFEMAGMETAEKRAGQKRAVVCYGAHSLRHHFVTAAAAAGLPSMMIRSITGHATDTMLEHYQQIGSGLVSEFARRLGKVTGDKKALPAAGSPRLVDAGAVRSIAVSMAPGNWREKRDDLIALADSAGAGEAAP